MIIKIIRQNPPFISMQFVFVYKCTLLTVSMFSFTFLNRVDFIYSGEVFLKIQKLENSFIKTSILFIFAGYTQHVF